MRKHIGMWLILLAVAALLAPAMLPAQGVPGRVNDELDMVVSALGAGQAKRVVDAANRQYEKLFVGNGWVRSAAAAYVEEPAVPHADRFMPWVGKLTSATNGYLLSLAGIGYAMLVRLNILAVWTPYVLPFLLAAMIDGAVRRRIKLMSFGFVSPVALSVALHSVVALAFLPLLYLILPVPVSPLVVPFWAIATAPPLMLLAANIQRIRG